MIVTVAPLVLALAFGVMTAVLFSHGQRTAEEFSSQLEKLAPDLGRLFNDGVGPLLSMVEAQSEDPVLLLEVDSLNRLVDSLNRMPAVKSALFVNADGSVLAAGFDETEPDLKETDLLPARLALVAQPRQRSLEQSGNELIYSNPFFRQGDYVARVQIVFAISKLADVRERMLAAGRELEAQSKARGRTIAMTGAAVSLLVLIASMLLWRRLLLRLHRLGDAARALASNQWDVTIGRVRNDEIGDLQHAFGQLRGDLWAEKQQTHALLEKLSEAAYYDTLTALPNRKMFTEHLVRSCASAHRSKMPFALMFIDLDGFKQVNDELGHEAGDELLRAVADQLQFCVRESDCVAIAGSGTAFDSAEDHQHLVSRLGGDEFTIILEQIESPEAAGLVAQRMIDRLDAPIALSNGNAQITQITLSVGVAVYSESLSTPEQLLQAADHAMYRAKRGGKNQYRYANKTVDGQPTKTIG